MGGALIICLLCASSIALTLFLARNEESPGPARRSSGPAPAPAPARPPAPVVIATSQAARDANPGALMGQLSAECGEVRAFDPNETYSGPSGDNYYNYCHSMVISRTAACKAEACANENVMQACRDECLR